jgi:single-strand DNA-binding protein
MAGYQNTTIIGNVGRDPEMRYTGNGVAVCDFTVAVNRKFRTGDEQREEVTWFRVTTWRNMAEICHEYVKRGMLVFVSGAINASAYIPKDGGEPRASLDVTARDVQFLTRQEDEQPARESSERQPF